MNLTQEEERILCGHWGEAARRALEMQIQVGEFFGAQDLVPIRSAHVMADMEVIGEAGLAYIESLVDLGAQCVVPTTTDPRSVDFAFYRELGQDEAIAEKERRLVRAFQRLGAMTCNTCINYQSVDPPQFGDHLAWGDTGAVIYANSVAGARSNFEGGPAALAAAITGRTPRYGYHLPEHRRATVIVEVRDRPVRLSDWGALGCAVGRVVDDYWQVPALVGLEGTPTPDQFKHLGAALASYGSLAMFHLVGITPEARTLAEATGGADLCPSLTIERGDLQRIYMSFVPEKEDVDLVVLGTPHLSLYEIQDIAQQLDGKRVSDKTLLLCTTNAAFKRAADDLGYTAIIERAGGRLLSGVCFYLMTPRELAQRHGFRTLVTNSAKLVNIIQGYGYDPVFRPTATCIQAAIAGKLDLEVL